MTQATLDAVTSFVPGGIAREVAHAARAGDVLHGRYLVLGLLGEGGMGRVYRVRDLARPKRELALKTIRADLVHAARLELFKAEFRTMSDVVHPNIARVYDFETGVEHAFTMELVRGRDLFAATEGAPLDQVIDHVVAVCRALAYLHVRDIVHGDLKPSNVLVTDDGEVKVVDFGLSGAMRAGLALGTPAYMAPEVRTAGGDARVDLYALGVTLYQLLVRRLPAGQGWPREVAPALRMIVDRLCERDAARRYASAEEVIEALAAATGRTVEARTANAAGRLVGRDDEVEALLASCLAGTAGISRVVGISGIGKTRLMAEVKKRLQLVGVTYVETRCYDGVFDELQPVSECVDAIVRLGRSERHASALRWLREGDADVGDREGHRMQRLRELAELVVDAAETTPIAIHVDDLQWARTATCDFLRLVCEQHASRRDAGRGVRLAIVASMRGDELAGRPCAELVERGVASHGARIELAPLPPAATRELIDAMLGASAPAAMVERVYADTGGQPFFVEELVRVVLERGATDVELPSSIAAAIEHRLAPVPERDREVLAWLAVYALPMPLAVLASVVERPVGAAIERLAERRLVERVGGDAVRLAHDRLRELILRGIVDLAERHGRLVDTLDRLANGDELVFERAHHAWHAGEPARALAWALRAAELAEHRSATDVAIDNYERVAALARGEEALRRRAIDRMLELCAMAGQWQRLVAIAEAELARRPDPLDRARLYQLQGEALGLRGRLTAGLACLRRAIELAGGRVPAPGLRRRAAVAWQYVRHAAALRFDRDALTPTELHGRARRAATIRARCFWLTSVYSMLNGDDDGIGLVFVGLDDALALGRDETARRVLQGVALAHHIRGDHAASERLILAARAMCESDVDRAQVLPTEILAHQMTQRPIYAGQPAVEAQQAQLLEAIELMSTHSKALYSHLARMVAATTIWHFTEQVRLAPEVFRWSDAMRDTVHRSFVHGCGAVLALVEGHTARAVAAYAEARAMAAPPMYRAWIDASFAYTCAITGDTTRARTALDSAFAAMAELRSRTATSAWAPTFAIGTCLALAARGVTTPALDAYVDQAVERLARMGGQLSHNAAVFREAGRLFRGRSSPAALEAAQRTASARWRGEAPGGGHPDTWIAGALALRLRGDRAAARWSREAIATIEQRYPAPYTARVRELLSSETAVVTLPPSHAGRRGA